MSQSSYPIVFNERSRVGRKIFLLHEDSLEITSYVFGKTQGQSIQLRSLSPDYQAVSRHSSLLVLISAIFTILCGIVAVTVYRTIPELQIAYQAAILFLVLAIRGTPKINYYAFYDIRGNEKFRVVVEEAAANEIRLFLQTLIEHIEGKPTVTENDSEPIPKSADTASFKYSAEDQSQKKR